MTDATNTMLETTKITALIVNLHFQQSYQTLSAQFTILRIKFLWGKNLEQ